MQRFKSLLRDNGIWLGKLIRTACILVVIYGVYSALTYSAPMLQGNYKQAADSFAADVPIALYDAGLQRYREGDFKGTVRILNDAYNACLGAQGVVDDGKRKLAADIKFLAGNALVNDNQLQQAVEAYKDSLRLDPTNLYAKYNLELLQSMNGGKGPGNPDQQQPGIQPGKGGKRGI